MEMQVVARTYEELKQLTGPAPVVGGQMEAYAYTLFDTAPIATGDTTIRFFNAVRAPGLTNLETAGSLPNPEFLRVERLAVQLYTPPGATEASTVTPWTQQFEFFMSSFSELNLKLQSKDYGSYPLNLVAGGCAVNGFGYSEATSAGTFAHQLGTTGANGSFGYPIGGSLNIRPTTSLAASINLGVAATAALDGLYCRLMLTGTKFRAVL